MFSPYMMPPQLRQNRLDDPSDVRLGSVVQCPTAPFAQALGEIEAGDVVLWGYADDRGVDRNGGRPGAAEGPDEIRKIFYRLTPPANLAQGKGPRLWDFGNLRSWSLQLDEAQEFARSRVSELRAKGARLVTLGGGHDWAFPDFSDFFSAAAGTPAHLINVDAHLDMRPLPQEAPQKSHSGTPFRQILSSPLKGDQNRLSVIGLQQQCNAAAHLKWAQGHRVTTLFLEELPLALEKQWSLLQDRLNLNSRSETRYGLSIDMDAFSQAHSPGVSAPQAFGLEPRLIWQLVRELAPQAPQLGIYETNPRFDQDGATARLAARLIHAFIYQD